MPKAYYDNTGFFLKDIAEPSGILLGKEIAAAYTGAIYLSGSQQTTDH